MERIRFKTVVISDVHMGARFSKVGEAARFLNRLSCERLIMAGDIIDGWQLKQIDDKWTVQESAFFNVIMNMMDQDQTEVVYVTGNHDDFLDYIIPCQLFNISLVNEYLIEDFGKRFVVIHGHAFDSLGKEKYSFSKVLKHSVKKAVNYISGFESDLADFARAKKCDGIICGHIHHPEDKMLKHGIRYLNCGDWVESLTALAQDFDGNWKILNYKDLVEE